MARRAVEVVKKVGCVVENSFDFNEFLRALSSRLSSGVHISAIFYRRHVAVADAAAAVVVVFACHS